MERTPTVCEVNYNPLESGVTDGDIYTPFRFRWLQTFLPDYYDRYRENLLNSDTFYEPVTCGYKVRSQSAHRQQCLSPVTRSYTHLALKSPTVMGGRAGRLGTTVSCYQANKQKHRAQPRAKTAPIQQIRESYSRKSPGFHLPSSPNFYDTEREAQQSTERVQWIESLNSWVSENNQNPAPYLSFCGAANLSDRGMTHDASCDHNHLPSLPCERYLAHMKMQSDASKMAAFLREQQLEEERRRRLERAEQARLAKLEAAALARQKAAHSAPPSRPKPQLRFEKPRPTPIVQPTKPPPKPPSPEPPKPPPKPPKQKKVPVPKPKEEPKPTPPPAPKPKSEPPPPPKPNPVVAPPPPPPAPKRKPEPPPPPPPPPAPPPAKPPVPKEPPPVVEPKPKKKEKPEHIVLPTEPETIMEEVSASTETSPRPASTQDSIVVEELPEEKPKTPTPEPVEPKARSPRPMEKKERWRAQKQVKEKEVEAPKLPDLPDFSKKKIGDWIYGDEDFSTKSAENDKPNARRPICAGDRCTIPGCLCSQISLALPELAPLPSIDDEEKKEKDKKEGNLVESLPQPVKPRWGKAKMQSSYLDMIEREQLAEERRAKAQKMLEKLRRRNVGDDDEDEVKYNPAYLEDYGWLAKFCILPRYLAEAYARTFEIVDEAGVGWLNPLDTILALRAANSNLTTAQEEFVYRVLQIAGYDISQGADVKLFSILAALSHKITSLDEWMKNLIQQMDFKMLEMKLFLCRTLWECCVDADTNTISIDQLCVELRAGGVSLAHEKEVRFCLKNKDALDLLDFLTYVPLFIMIHNSVVDNPLDDSRLK